MAAAITPSLKASARSAYRQLWRASSSTFAGDERTLQAWRVKMRQDSAQALAITDPTAYEEQVKLANDVAEVLRRNFAQARKIDGAEDRWELRFNKNHEMGSNETIKDPPPLVIPPRGKRVKKTDAIQSMTSDVPLEHTHRSNPSPIASSAVDHLRDVDSIITDPNTLDSSSLSASSDTPLDESLVEESEAPQQGKRPVFYSQLRKLAKQRTVPQLNEDDLEESFVRGHGPGGQSINKTNNNVQIIHRPTGIRVVCQQTRSLELNRMYARRILVDKLDALANPGLSKSELARAKQNERERWRKKSARKGRDEEDRARRKREGKEARRKAKEQDDDDDDD